ncbi:MAG: LysR family transcriptional regulator [Alphaproteobacteria bacterium]|nr:LysR family transcriptional regulator [Alphaproteobacteria bacterium]MBU0796306.1 LysR family transcriptional regulator [Alphaproteobacteria bacterium]MBU0889177.1 LysR family transcriptional regulator [Alphaproteobacteria bacterium]MBU1812211.1 LysR family transcriptional regulator [Alphaproteobacteria bacterium]
MQDLNAMLVFARVVEAGSFSAAAEKLALSKSAVSKQVARLEDQLGVRLLNRTTRRLSLTEAGELFFARSTEVVAAAEAAEQAVTSLQDKPRGTLRLNSSMSFGQRHLGPAIPEFLFEYPDLSIDMTLTDRFVDLVKEGYDMAIRIGNMPDSSLIQRRLCDMQPLILASPDYLVRRGAPATPVELTQHNCLCYAYQATGDEWRFSGPEGVIRVRVSGQMRANNGDVLMEAAIAGMGIVQLPSFICGDAVRDGRLVPILTNYTLPGAAIHAVYPHARHVSTKVRAFVDFLAQRFGSEPYWDRGL